MTQDELRSVLKYSSKTGQFVWIKRIAQCIQVGDVAGRTKKTGYREIKVFKKFYMAHRLAWLYMTGSFPVHQIDHINGDKSDNRFSNLRDVTPSMNRQNMYKAYRTNRTGLLGVYKATTGYRAFIKAGGMICWSRLFKTPEKAHEAYLEMKRSWHEGCTI